MYTAPDKVTEQGYDMQFGTNVLGVYIELACHKTSDPQKTFRSLLPHKVAPACSHGDHKELTRWDHTSRQCGLYRSQQGSAWGYPMVHGLARRKWCTRGTEETRHAQIIWPEQIGENMVFSVGSHSLSDKFTFFGRETSYSQMNSLDDTAEKGSCPFRYIRDPSTRICRVIQVHLYSSSDGLQHTLCHMGRSILCLLVRPLLPASSMAKWVFAHPKLAPRSHTDLQYMHCFIVSCPLGTGYTSK